MRPDRLDCPREGVFPLNIGRYRVATPKTMSGKNEGEWFSEKWTSKTRAPKHPHFLIAKQQDSCDKTAGNGGQNMPMLQGSKIGRSLPGKPFTFDSHQPLSPHKQQTQARQSYRLNPKVPAGSRRNSAAAAGGAPQSQKAAGAKRRGRRRDQSPQQPRAHISPAAPTNNGPIAGRSQQRHRRRGPGLVFRTLRRPVWRLVRGSEGAGQGATHGRGRSENQARPPPDRSTATRRAA